VDAAGLSTEELYYRPLYTLARLASIVGISRLARIPALAARSRPRRLVLGLILNHPERISSDLARAS
jgi:hypothetical protein